ncbi:expressed unknown protein [Seminavis robusta]|uniref:Uncharacterized protein n=1 Tax=Seminavis robusta TaxID=568900 RepID=A0A9N8HT60_9STRA|nr:expressed unknown protein [Seminavis robusta]|eukprot:Sro1472_g275490.1 n/a (160) ;mRNA; f:11441-11920
MMEEYDVYETVEDEDSSKAWIAFIIEKDSEILKLTRNGEIMWAVFASLCAMVVHMGMVVFTMARRKHSSDDSWKWQMIMKLWTVGVHVQAMTFHVLPVLTLLPFNPLLWCFMAYLWLGVLFHQWSLLYPEEIAPKVLTASVIVEPKQRRIKKQGSRRKI